MERSFKEALKHRRSYYSIASQSPISNKEIEEIINWAVVHVPSAFNSQSTRVVLLLGDDHQKLWQLVKDTLQKIVPEKVFESSKEKIDNSFACGYGTILFFEDQTVVQSLQKQFPLYQENFPIWALQTSGMHQLAVWTMLKDAGLGATLQHYNPLIDEQVHSMWNLPATWQLLAQMPFGLPTIEPDEKECKPLKDRVKVFG